MADKGLAGVLERGGHDLAKMARIYTNKPASMLFVFICAICGKENKIIFML
jgi:hypothetical protein